MCILYFPLIISDYYLYFPLHPSIKHSQVVFKPHLGMCLNTSYHFVSLLFAAVVCPYPSGISHGRYRMITSTEARYDCNTGYTLVGEDRVCCNSERKWIPDAPSCKRKLLTHIILLKHEYQLSVIRLHYHDKFYSR